MDETAGERQERRRQVLSEFEENAVLPDKSSVAGNEEFIAKSAEVRKRGIAACRNHREYETTPKKRRVANENAVLEDLLVFSDNFEMAGRVVSVELENFMCHPHLKVEFDLDNNNCFYIGGPNGSGKSALFAALNIGLGGRGNCNERGNSVKDYIKEGKSRSKIRIVLTNKGSGRHPDYGPEVVVERVIGHTNSSYVIKSIDLSKQGRKERTISTKKSDLERLLIRFDIQLTNPIFWMSQDRCRAFLQDMKPDKLYTVFMFATELDYTRLCYQKIEDYISDIRQLMDALKDTLKRKKSQLTALNAQKEKMKTIEEKRAKLNQLGWTLIWLPVRDADKEMRKWEKAMAKADQAVEQLQKKFLDCDESIEAVTGKRSKIDEELGTFRAGSDSLREKVNDKRALVESKKKDCTERALSLKKKERELKEIDAQTSSIDQQIQQIQAKIQKSKEGQVNLPALEEKLRTIVDHISELEDLRKAGDAAYKKHCSELEVAAAKERTCLFDLRNAEEELRKSRAEKERAEAMSKSDIARFGVDVPTVLEIIEKNAARFSQKPVGPLGMYVKVRDQRWLLAVEFALMNVLRCFLCDNAGDKKLLEKLLRQNGVRQMPSFIISKYSDYRYNTEPNEPPQRFVTVARVVEVAESNVFNTLVDQTQMESILLIETDEQARQIMYIDPPPNVYKGFTKSGSEVFPRTNGKVYRFYSNSKGNDIRFLASSHPLDAESLNAIIRKLEEGVNDARQHFLSMKQKASSLRPEMEKLKTEVAALSGELEDAQSERRRLERKIDLERVDENADNQIVNLMMSKEEFRGRKALVKEEIEEIRQQLDDCKKHYREAQEEKYAADAELQEFEKDAQKFKSKRDAVLAELEKIQDEKNGHRRNIGKLASKKNDYDTHLRESRAAYEKAFEATKKCAMLPCPQGMSNPPNFDDLPDTEEASKEYKNLEEFIIAAKKCLGSAVTTIENLKALTLQFRRDRDEYRELARLLKRLENALTLRQEKYVIMKHAIALRLCAAYSRLMGMRNFRGLLQIDHQRQVIEVIAETHRKNGEGEDELSLLASASRSRKVDEMLRDLKGLSGGERTYTLACFIMALWETMESPFRCMDEFDVFLDLNNRKLVMELLVDLATQQYPHNQFIFFTPQGISELTLKDRVQLFEMPKARPQ